MTQTTPNTFSRLPEVSESDCVFCRIVRGEMHAWRVAEADAAVAFLDINPIARGHTLVVPRRHAVDLLASQSSDLAATLALVRDVARAVIECLAVAGVSVWQTNGQVAGQTVPHTHFHVLPRSTGDRARVLPDRQLSEPSGFSELAAALSKQVQRRDDA